MLEVLCPHCQAHLHVPDEGGVEMICGACNKPFTTPTIEVPTASPVPPNPFEQIAQADENRRSVDKNKRAVKRFMRTFDYESPSFLKAMGDGIKEDESPSFVKELGDGIKADYNNNNIDGLLGCYAVVFMVICFLTMGGC
jgi:hypothetical protein